MREKIEYTMIKVFLGVSKIAPKVLIYRFIRWLTLLVYYLDKKRRYITVQNLKTAFPEKSDSEIKHLAKEVYTELSKTISEILLMFVDRFDIDKAVVNREEIIAKLKTATENAPRGIVAMTAHFSNWELLAHFLAKHGLPMLVVGREGNNKLIENRITQPFRKKYGNDTTTKKKAILSMVKRLKSGGNVGILIDQKAGGPNAVAVDFMGKPAQTITSLAMLKHKLDPQIIPFFAARVGEGKYKIIMQDPIEYRAEEESDEAKRIEKMTAEYNKVMGAVIREYPSQWFWMHNRWRIAL
ncbi:lysophospholipid acyltransferase family protein [Sulfurovum mangrovi]|uniref:lysophospholipid acyltransferase family protein n=1 Tax=Sulfurovum mangrovi TaxID=2893889 RepID=UPI001E48B15E|nr:lysophospholipid acyltransferase family protein [Sulfurovum mangrovi]UFH58849.1 lysophospholipid acyltransferase family protein [Sulfurovum mangrovi]